jgi:hypothetical protein
MTKHVDVDLFDALAKIETAWNTCRELAKALTGADDLADTHAELVLAARHLRRASETIAKPA